METTIQFEHLNTYVDVDSKGDSNGYSKDDSNGDGDCDVVGYTVQASKFGTGMDTGSNTDF